MRELSVDQPKPFISTKYSGGANTLKLAKMPPILIE
jgi:hypothetical protein